MRLPLSVAALAAALSMSSIAPLSAHADEGEGRSLTDPLKAFLLEKACDLPVASKEGDDCKDEPACTLKRSNGTPFAPDMPPWFFPLFMQWDVGAKLWAPALEKESLEVTGDMPGEHWAAALPLLSGVAGRLDTTGTATNKPVWEEGWGTLTHVNPTLVRWALRELVPTPDAEMCGATAQAVYDQAFRNGVRRLAEIYVDLKKAGLLKRVTVEELARNRNEQKGRFAQKCKALVKKEKDESALGVVDTACWWWLRRHAGDAKVVDAASGALVEALGGVLMRYDAPFFKKHKAHFPKP
jgi:hypothetical protein